MADAVVPTLNELLAKSIQELAGIYEGIRVEIEKGQAELATVRKAVETKEHERLRAELAELEDAVRIRKDHYEALKEQIDGEHRHHDQILASLESLRRGKEDLKQFVDKVAGDLALGRA
jgi:chromosome segregation ATPase